MKSGGQIFAGAKSGAKSQPFVRSGQKAAVHGGSLVVGLVAYSVGLNYLQHGWPGVTAWLKAKLMNKTAQDSSAVPAEMFRHHDLLNQATTGTAAVQTTPQHPAAPTPSGGTLYT